MTRIINSNSPGKRRGHQLRTIGEILRHLAERSRIDEEAQDMVAQIVICLRQIDKTVEESSEAWDRRGYWKKAADFQLEWEWVPEIALKLESMIKAAGWEQLPELMVKLYPHFSGMNINKYTRPASTWKGAYSRLV